MSSISNRSSRHFHGTLKDHNAGGVGDQNLSYPFAVFEGVSILLDITVGAFLLSGLLLFLWCLWFLLPSSMSWGLEIWLEGAAFVACLFLSEAVSACVCARATIGPNRRIVLTRLLHLTDGGGPNQSREVDIWQSMIFHSMCATRT